VGAADPSVDGKRLGAPAQPAAAAIRAPALERRVDSADRSRAMDGYDVGSMSAATDVTDRERSSMAQGMTGGKAVLFGGVLGGVVALDLVTKLMVQRTVDLYQQIPIVGDYIRLTYIHNPGAAFGIELGDHSRIIFLVLSGIALLALGAMYWFTPASDRLRLASIALICGGALGNLMDRVRSAAGVVDFLDVGVGTVRWPVFNVADIAVTTGAIVLALSLWKEEKRVEGSG
jgi:signal peptidase II